VTSVDVARHAGVSQSTVSLVFSGKGAGRVSEATQERVRRSARELGYRPNVAAQALRLGSSRAVALLVPDVTNPFFSRVLRGAQRAAQAAGYTVALVDTANDRRWEAQSFEALRAGPVDGYLLFEVSAPEALGPDTPAVLMEAEGRGRPSVRFDAEAGAAAAIGHLLDLGHRRIGHLAAAFDAPTFHLREAARQRVLSEAGLDPDEQPRMRTPIDIDSARDAAGPLLDERPTAVFCDDDVIAAGLYLAARERGLAIPRDLSVIGFDDMDFARVLEPPLTTVALDAEQLGASSFELLEATMAGRRSRRRIVLPAELLVRGSTGAPKAARRTERPSRA
jgi:DNA-binding LacI/PurR family transcriptional regulator